MSMDNIFKEAIKEANVAAEAAGKEWMANAKPMYQVFDSFSGKDHGTMLDMCGNAHVRVKDARTKFAKYLKDVHGETYTITVPITNKYRMRQEHGLQKAMARAALEVLTEKYNIKKLYIWDYID